MVSNCGYNLLINRMTLGIGDLLNVVCHHISIFDCENDASLTAGMSYRMYTFFDTEPNVF